MLPQLQYLCGDTILPCNYFDQGVMCFVVVGVLNDVTSGAKYLVVFLSLFRLHPSYVNGNQVRKVSHEGSCSPICF